jgi:hypothetical protein
VALLHNRWMLRIAASLLFGIFMGLISYVLAARLSEWYETGLLLMHKRMAIGPDAVTYSSDPILFLIEFGLNIFLIAMGGVGVLAMCREIIGEMIGPQSRLLRLIDWHYANQMPSIVLGVAGWFLLIVFAFGLLYRGA